MPPKHRVIRGANLLMMLGPFRLDVKSNTKHHPTNIYVDLPIDPHWFQMSFMLKPRMNAADTSSSSLDCVMWCMCLW